MEPADGDAESQVPLQKPHVANGHLEMGEEPGHHGNSRTRIYQPATVALGVAIVTSLGLLIAVIALAVSLSGRSPAKRDPCCPDGWVGYQGKCFYFSEGEGNWTDSRSRCSALGASLAAIDTLQEMAFLLRHKGKPHHWISLRRDPEQPWKWANGTEFNHLFEIQGGGDCAYLNDENGASSSRCSGEKRWVCSKPDAFTKAKEGAVKGSLEQDRPN
ncbi:C-type lectin domain family 2 member B-like [Pelodiscus sinensis]|uniref:C-type lectin domain family 2 member B-like n=1 Tax=Pelodiscus sinensis TaxID=13735 RepID=UPI003F6D6B5E